MDLELARMSLKSNNHNEIVQAVAAMGAKGALTDLQSLIGLVKNPDPRIAAAAVDSATRLILDNLLTRFSDLEKKLREKLGAIMESLDPAIIEEITKEIYSNNDERRLRAVQILGLLKKNPNITNVLARLVQDRDVKIRATAVNLLGKMIGPSDHTIILSLLGDPDKRVRANTVEAIESLGNKRLLPVLIRLRKDPNNRIRGNVLKAMYNLGHTEIEDDILAMLSHSDNFMRASGLWVITTVKTSTRKIEDAAGFCLLSDNEMVKSNAQKALSSLSTPRSLGYLKYLR